MKKLEDHSPMATTFWIWIAFIAGWLLLQLVILPRLGIPT